MIMKENDKNHRTKLDKSEQHVITELRQYLALSEQKGKAPIAKCMTKEWRL